MSDLGDITIRVVLESDMLGMTYYPGPQLAYLVAFGLLVWIASGTYVAYRLLRDASTTHDRVCCFFLWGGMVVSGGILAFFILLGAFCAGGC
ncbi:MAG: hypothetical protein PHV57_07180 [Methanomicrobiaceae archaeon]|nr:hypothetical protein [Methanomicrobiaceae archaeon]